ncbi:MAG: Beta-lactamase, partial [Myxococcaceae bacterium]|nr:Beta-lactamase [Myxococcaceae bacterium]
TGVVTDADFVIPWDGVTRDFPAWNRDHTLRSAIQVSAVPYFQELARRVGPEREAEWVRAFSYGNADTGSKQAVDRFWLDGPLAISPVEQLDFLRRFATGKLPVSARSREIVRDILVLDRHADIVLRGKTGWGQPHQLDQVGWFVGYVEQRDQRTYVAVLLHGQPEQDDNAFLALRRTLAEGALTELGAW